MTSQEVIISFRDRTTSTSGESPSMSSRLRQFVIPVNSEDTVAEISAKVAATTGHKTDEIRLIFCGKELSESATFESLMLGASTTLLALAVDVDAKKKTAEKLKEASQEAQSAAIGSFHVYCKGCECVSQGKLRMYCGNCDSSAVIARKEPSGWSDVLYSKRIPVYCTDCEAEGCHARFAFKCVKCKELAVVLPHLRPNRSTENCIICGESEEPLVADLGCGHPTCLPCFEAYLLTTFEQSKFSMKPPFGYSINCALYGCDSWVTDAHHFYLLGAENYKKYQLNAAEKYVAMHEDGHFCPRPECGAAFMVEPWVEEDRLVSCPKCLHTFCSECRTPGRCSCADAESEDQKTIRTTSKRCPSCSVNIERNGGCTHIHCTQCGEDWCFVCVKPWSDECQWDHWFE
ncbi:hypothetical protein L596_017312 [Steinernema carpocapsae]|uniref:E3 ubiquitin-protein ligase parkin n=1 Tax=Steinernema carpocapsae TaxID=34508 RepID=A0A4U5N1J7_STECR|nr:hypothetical protein L596_017312 [Steinernema carpocapsae]